jgi:hypothetical protein
MNMPMRILFLTVIALLALGWVSLRSENSALEARVGAQGGTQP